MQLKFALHIDRLLLGVTLDQAEGNLAGVRAIGVTLETDAEMRSRRLSWLKRRQVEGFFENIAKKLGPIATNDVLQYLSFSCLKLHLVAKKQNLKKFLKFLFD